MKIQNKGMALTALAIGGKLVTGDDEGVFDLEDAAAKQLLATPGWHAPIVEGVPAAAPEPAPAPEPEPEPEAAPEPEEAPVEAPVEEEDAPEPEVEEAPPEKPKKKKRNPK